MTDMAASRKVMLDFITDLQLQKDKALAAAQAAQDRAEMMDKELKSQRSLVQRLQVSVSESRSDGIRKYFPSNLITTSNQPHTVQVATPQSLSQ